MNSEEVNSSNSQVGVVGSITPTDFIGLQLTRHFRIQEIIHYKL